MTTPQFSVPTTMKAAFIEAPGPGVDVLTYGDFPTPTLATETSVLIKLDLTSVNYIDVYHRTGLYKLANYPAVLGRDGAGIVVQVGRGVEDKIQVGQRVAFAASSSYAEYCSVEFSNVVKLDDSTTNAVAVTMMLQGLTAHYLAVDIFPNNPGDWILIHAGAGGTGSIAIQIAKARGLNVITTVGSDEKIELVKKLGADHVINYNKTEDKSISEQVREITNGLGVRFALDGVGATTYMESIKSVAKRGCVVLFGNAAGPVPALDPLLLTRHGSIYICRPTLFDFMQTQDELQYRFDDLVKWFNEGKLTFVPGPQFPLSQIQQAHEAIQDRTRVGKILIKVSESESKSE